MLYLIPNIASGDKIAQLVLVPVVLFRTSIVDKSRALYEDSPNGSIVTVSKRGSGALGSTDKKSSVTGLCPPNTLEDPPKKYDSIRDYIPNGF